MRKKIINIALISIISFNYAVAVENNIILGVGVNHRFIVNSKTKTNLNNYSVSFQYSRSISNYFSIGVKGIMENPKILSESFNQVERIQSPLLLIINHNLLADLNNIYIQLGGGMVVDYGDYNSRNEQNTNFTGYCIGLATGSTFKLLDNLGVNFEMGLLYKKFEQYVFRNNNSQVKANIQIGMLLDF